MNKIVYEYIKSKIKIVDNMSLYLDIIMYKDKSIEKYLIHNDIINRMDEDTLNIIDKYEKFNILTVLQRVNLKNINILKRYANNIYEFLKYFHRHFNSSPMYECIMNYDCIEDLYNMYSGHEDFKKLCYSILSFRKKELPSSLLFKIINQVELTDSIMISCFKMGTITKEIFIEFLNFNKVFTQRAVSSMIEKDEKINLNENDLNFFVKYIPIDYMIKHYSIPFNILKKNILYINDNDDVLKNLFIHQNIPFSFIRDYVPEDSLYLALAYNNDIDEKFFEKNIKKLKLNNKYQFEFVLHYSNLSKCKNCILYLLNSGYVEDVFKNLAYNAKLNRLDNIDFLINKNNLQYLLKFNLYPYIKHKICFNESIIYNLNKDY